MTSLNKSKLLNLLSTDKNFEKFRKRGSLPNLHTLSKNFISHKPDRDIKRVVKRSMGKKFEVREKTIINSYLKRLNEKGPRSIILPPETVFFLFIIIGKEYP